MSHTRMTMADSRKDRTIMGILTAAAIINVLIVSLLLTHSADVHQPQGRAVQHELIVNLNDTDQKLLKFADMSKKEPISLWQKNRIVGLPSGCPDDIFIITLVISTPDGSTRRHAIRSSWATTGNDHVLTVFLMGEHPDSRDRDGILRLNNEVVKYKDILTNFKHESRKAGSSLMVLLGIQWILEHCQQVRYVLIVHDTMFVNYRRLMKVLEHHDIQDNDGKLLIGNIQRDQIPIRNPASSYYISEKQFSETVYPPFCISSAGYVMNVAAARDINNSFSTNNNLFPCIDVLTGIVGRDHNWTLIHHGHLFTTTRMRSKPCSVDRVVTAVAPDNPDAMIAVVKHLSNLTVLKSCVDPDLDVVLPDDINNKHYLHKVLRLHLDHPDICFTQGRKKRDIFMIAFINSHPKNWEIRNAIRRTWGSDLSIGGELIRVFFILGKQTHSANRSYIMTEDAQHQDILQGNFIDSFANRTLKVIAGLKWILKNCDHAHYLYAGAEDTFVNFKSIVRYLKELRSKGDARERFYLGSRIYGNERLSVKREKRANTKKLKVSSKQYRGRYYPTYCSGSGYVLSSDVVPSMYRTALRTPLIGVADVFQGILAKRLDVEPVGHPGFKTWGGRVDACSLRSYDTLTVRGITNTPEQLFHVWETYTNKFVNCSNV